MTAAWYTVHLDSPPQGTVGDTSASSASRTLYDKELFSTNPEIKYRSNAIIESAALAPYQYALVRFAVNLADFGTLDPATPPPPGN